MAVDWNTVLADIETGLRDADTALKVGAALGIPEAGLLDAVDQLAQGIVTTIAGLKAGTLIPIAAAVQGVEEQADAAALAKLGPRGSGT